MQIRVHRFDSGTRLQQNQALSCFFPHNFLIHSRYTVFCVCISGITLLNTMIALTVFASNFCSHGTFLLFASKDFGNLTKPAAKFRFPLRLLIIQLVYEDLLGARLILKPQHFVEPAQRSDPSPDGAVRRVCLQAIYVQTQRLRANWKRLAISFPAPIDKCARVGVV